jgi:uncharacterized protein YecE (DUF72 family)
VTTGRLFAGTSGFAFKEWIGAFYPEGTKSAEMLPYYASRLGALEVNYTFRQHPAPETMSRWVEQTPGGFVFAPKANGGITHYGRLKNAAERLARFYEAIAPLGDRLGPVLFQCPPNLKYEPDVLEGFLADLAAEPAAKGTRAVVEPRHPSWFTGEAATQLAAAGVALCVADTDESPKGVPDLATGPGFVYLRLRRSRYSARLLGQWAGTIRSALDAGADVHAFFKHEGDAAGARDAMALARKLGATSRPARPRRP